MIETKYRGTHKSFNILFYFSFEIVMIGYNISHGVPEQLLSEWFEHICANRP